MLLGIDPGLSSMGYAFVRILKNNERVESIGVIRTKPSTKKQKIRSADDVTRRVVYLITELDSKMAQHGRISAVCAESFSPPRNASSAAKVAMAWGAVLGATSGPHILVSPQEIKKAVCGSNSASMEDIERTMIERYGDCEDVWDSSPQSQRNHGWDALAAVVSCLSDPFVEVTRQP